MGVFQLAVYFFSGSSLLREHLFFLTGSRGRGLFYSRNLMLMNIIYLIIKQKQCNSSPSCMQRQLKMSDTWLSLPQNVNFTLKRNDWVNDKKIE